MSVFNLPDLGEGLPEAEINTWHVTVGQEVERDQPLVTVETAKALVEIPVPYKGKVLKLFGVPGDIVKTGAALIEIEVKDTGTVAGKLEENNVVVQEVATPLTNHYGTSIKVTPAIRALAKRFKVDLKLIRPLNPNGIITTQEVELAARQLSNAVPSEPLSGIRRRMAEVMQQAHSEVVPVTVVEDVRLFGWQKEQDITVTLIQAIIKACQKEITLNAWYDSGSGTRRLMPTVNIGIAMDTKEGLLVPVIREAEKLDVIELRSRLDSLKEAVYSRKILPETLQGGTITLSNFGKFTGKYATPIILPPMVAILAAGRLREEVVAVQQKMMVLMVLPLSLTFDHRVVTGGEASRFLKVVVEFLENESSISH